MGGKAERHGLAFAYEEYHVSTREGDRGGRYAGKNAHTRGNEHLVSEYSMPCSLSTVRRVL